ncbi:YgiQ family radical SAM protein [Pleionea mediterranea]|uniref:Putative radical SAM protein YgiQ n=1 Tax=Pleionea mediterranea TaxID=523701 RepID=A0A316FA85_9GAMM|nr:YgiQ family radical SAM protein [Pleionea mediterranea]PWK43614.1 putative radical SAM protein YgiQ [Pleionea mediterranea]
MKQTAQHLFEYPKYWAECYGTAPYLPMSRQEMDELGWDSCDIILVVGDAYIDHPSFGMAVMGRFLESQGFRVGIIAQPDWNNPDEFSKLGTPNLFFGVSAGNMDSMINRYTADLKVRNDDAYTPHGVAGKRPDRALTVYCQKLREIYKDVPIVAGGIEASLRRIAQYDHWSGKVRRSVLLDSGADIVLYGNAERAIAEIANELSLGKPIQQLTDIRGTAFIRDAVPGGFTEVDSTRIDWPGQIDAIPSPYEYVHQEGETNHDSGGCSKQEAMQNDSAATNSTATNSDAVPIRVIPMPLTRKEKLDPAKTVVRLPSFEKVSKDPALYAHASRVLHLESNPNNAKALVQKHGTKEIWVNRPPIPLETDEMDGVFDLPYQRKPHPSYGDAHIPAYEMIKFSVNIMRGCFGGCTFCSITEHEGRVIQSRSQESILKEIENIRDKTPGFTGTISDLGGPTANMYQLNCVSDEIQSNCRKLSCVYPTICPNLVTDHSPTTQLYRKARNVDGVKRVAIASGLRYDLAVEDPEYVKELVQHHVGGYLKIAPEHTESNTLDKMMKPGIGSYDAFKKLFDKYSKEAGKEQYLIPYFIAAHPGCTDEDMINLALWCKKNDFRPDQVQTFYPSPMALATAMYYSDRDPLHKVSYKSDKMYTAKELSQRKVHKALLRYHDPKNWPFIRETLQEKGLTHLIGDGPECLIPWNDDAKGYSKNRTHGKRAGQKKAGPHAVKVKQTSSHKRAKHHKRVSP